MAAGIGMGAALALLMLFAAGVTRIIPLSALCLFAASLMTWIPLREEHGPIFALILYVFVSAVGIVISRNSPYTYLYALIFGNYGIVRYLLLTRVKDRFLTWLIRILYFDLLSALGVAAAQFIFGYDVMTLLPDVSVWAVFGIMQGGFIVFMLLYKFFAYLFDNLLRIALLPRR